MIYYANERSPYIQHYGVPGMKWGHHKYRSTINSKIQPSDKAWGNMYKAKLKKEKADKNFDRAYRRDNSILRRLMADKNDNKESSERLMKAARESENANKAYKKAKKAYKISKKYEKQQMKDMKTKYRKEYLSGKSAAGKVILKIIGSDKIYADTMYDMHKRSKVNKNWRT